MEPFLSALSNKMLEGQMRITELCLMMTLPSARHRKQHETVTHADRQSW
jgi:hypothetical protein